jgi:hypothetical protein
MMIPKMQRSAEQILRDGCATSTVSSALVPSNLLFVLDRSGSMRCNPPPVTDSAVCEAAPDRADPSSPSKWEVTHGALRAALSTLPTTASVGLSYFSNDGACGVNAQPSVELTPVSPGHLASVEASLAGVVPQGGTPMVGAVISAYQHLHQRGLSGKSNGRDFVVVLTDGEQSTECSNPPLCSDAKGCYEYLVKDEAHKAAGPGARIRTFVIGAPGSEPARSVLSQLAVAGGTAAAGCDPAKGNCHFDMTTTDDFASALGSALRAIVGEAITCELDLPAEADDPDALNVLYTPNGGGPTVVPKIPESACDAATDGWRYTNATPKKIRLCGEICDSLNNDAAGKVEVVVGCPVVLL